VASQSAGGRWAIASPHFLSTEAGVSAFRRGGNAVDAALAAAASLTVTLPDNCALGGDLFALVRAPSGSVSVVNASGPAAIATPVEKLREDHGSAMPIVGPQTVTVPGLLAGWESLWSMEGALSWPDVFAQAIPQAEEGLPVARSTAEALKLGEERFRADDGLAETFFPHGRRLREGELLRQARLADTLREVAKNGAGVLYRGEVGARWLKTMTKLGSALSVDDLREFEPEVTEPLRASHGSQEILTAPPNSQGAILLMILRILEHHDPLIDPLSADAPVLAKAFQAARDARTRYLSDPRVNGAARGSQLATVVPDPENADAKPAAHLGGDTVAVVAADGEGRAVSLIQSLFHSFGAGILDPDTGIIAHNRGAFFSLDPQSPNVLAPRKRPAHTLTPVLICEDGKLRGVLGTMGGLAQPQILTQVIQHLRRGATCEQAIARPRWVLGGIEVGSNQDQVMAEQRVPLSAFKSLADSGFRPIRLPARTLDAGEAQLIVRNQSGALEATSDPRCEGLASAD
jgi:gamma-glutamyltranspeptidase